ncbi:hypothetical protein OESDEN_02518 [Oesophagostomum dentatum]|uniref:Uncharacterized protein n=1 Tax=Oesophagostomum dentatum TaxID=61180 RepID=A0A0B1TN25_OESDE|nr:hypothetical protein OESDEN_02518 [Oesophagostomum dentatum]
MVGFLKEFFQIRGRSAFAELLTKAFIDVDRTGVVQAASKYAQKTAMDFVRPYHGISLLEDVWPSSDANPSVTLLLKH